MLEGAPSAALVAGPPSPPVPLPAKVDMTPGPKPASAPFPAASSETLSSVLPLASVSTTAPCRLPGAVGWNWTSILHVPETTVGQVVPVGTAVKSRLGAPLVKTEKLARVVLDGTVIVKTIVPGALKISKLGLAVT